MSADSRNTFQNASESSRQNRRPVREGTFDPEAICDTCGRFGAHRFVGRVICDECYAAGASCCPEFGRDSADDDES